MVTKNHQFLKSKFLWKQNVFLGATRPPPPDVPDFKCDFEKDMCGLVTEGYNLLAEWEINKGELGGRTGNYKEAV